MKYLVDVNLPLLFSVWHSQDYVHLKHIGESWSDEQVWQYAREHGLTIITKDTDFSHRILFSPPPPRVIHIRFGNMRFREFHSIISACWDDVCRLSETHKLVNVFKDHIEGIA